MSTNIHQTGHEGKDLPEPHHPRWMRILEWIWDLILTVLPILFLGNSYITVALFFN